MSKPTLYVVGDSTLAKFDDRSYLYPRYGYGTQLECYLDIDKINIVNLALSGRSSKSYLLEDNYKFLVDNIKEGDYLIIGFGHNNEKSDDVARFTSANKPIEDETSFMYSLNTFYIQMAINKKATPIICTPIVRLDLDKDYTGYSFHVTENGDYRECILNLANLVGILGIDLTTPTRDLFMAKSVEEASLHHAMTAGLLVDGRLAPNYKSVDKAHLNIFGAKYVAFLVVDALIKNNHKLAQYALEKINLPIKEKDLIVNPVYQYIPYNVPNLEEYQPKEQFKTVSKGWYGTCFGLVECNPQIKENGYVAYEEDDKFIVGQYGPKAYGKFHASADGFACVFKQVSMKKNFIIKAKAKVIKYMPCKQTSFGIMLRDDIYLNQTSVRESTMNNYVSAGFLTLNVSMNVIHARECTTEYNMSGNIIDGFYNLGDEAYLEIVRLGQSITVKVIYKNKEYIKNYMDFDLIAVDGEYAYVCLYASNGTVIEFSNVDFEITGTAKEA